MSTPFRPSREQRPSRETALASIFEHHRAFSVVREEISLASLHLRCLYIQLSKVKPHTTESVEIGNRIRATTAHLEHLRSRQTVANAEEEARIHAYEQALLTRDDPDIDFSSLSLGVQKGRRR